MMVKWLNLTTFYPNTRYEIYERQPNFRDSPRQTTKTKKNHDRIIERALSNEHKHFNIWFCISHTQITYNSLALSQSA